MLSQTCLRSPNITVYGDRAATVAMLRTRLGVPAEASCEKKLTFVVKSDHPPDLDARLGDYAGFLSRTQYLSGTIDDDPDSYHSRDDSMRVKVVADDALEVDGTRVAFPLPKNAGGGGSGGSVTRVDYVFRPTDTIERVIEIVTSVEDAYRGQLEPYGSLSRHFDDGVRPPPKPHPTLGAGSITVSGRLPPEVIQRIVRQNMSRFRLCYENGLRKNPDLRGRVAVKFIIDRSGGVSLATDGGSDLPDPAAVSCIVRAFQSLSFPQPEGGIVTVIYPLDFETAKQ